MAQIEHINSRALNKPVVELASYKNILLSKAHRLVLADDEEVELTKFEFDLLCVLMSNPGRAFSFEQLHRHMWDDDITSSPITSVKNTIARIRKKIGNVDFIENIYGFGYKIPL